MYSQVENRSFIKLAKLIKCGNCETKIRFVFTNSFVIFKKCYKRVVLKDCTNCTHYSKLNLRMEGISYFCREGSRGGAMTLWIHELR